MTAPLCRPEKLPSLAAPSSARTDNHRATLYLIAALTASVMVTGCGQSGSDRADASAEAPNVTAENTAPLRVGGQVNASPSTPLTPSSTTEVDEDASVSAPTTAPDTEGTNEPLREGVPTRAGVTYSLDAAAGSDAAVSITDPHGGRFGFVVDGWASLSAAEDGSVNLVDIFELSSMYVYKDATYDLSQPTGALG